MMGLVMGLMPCTAMAQDSEPSPEPVTAPAVDDVSADSLFAEPAAETPAVTDDSADPAPVEPATQPAVGDVGADSLFAEPPAEPAAETSEAAGGSADPALAEIPVTPLAAESESAALTEDRPSDATQLDDVVVTVTKRAQVSRDIPSSMTVLGGEKLEQLGIRKLKDIFTLVPGVNMQDELAGHQRKITVRGVGPQTGTNQTVGSVMGDIPISDPYGASTVVDPNPWDMRTVEILKGPQGTLFGATSLAGLIRYVPNNPELGLWQGKAFYDYTSIDRGGTGATYGAALNIPLGDTVALRASGIIQDLPGLLDSDNPARQEEDVDTGRSWNGRVMGLWEVSDRFTINAWYTQEQRNSDDINFTTFREGNYTRDDAPTASPTTNEYKLATLDLRYAFDWATLVSLSGYQEKTSDIDIDASNLLVPAARAGISYLRAARTAQTEGVLQELRLVSPDDGGKLSWLIGGFYSTYSAAIRADLLVNLGALGPLTPLLSALEQLQLGQLLALLGPDGIAASSSGYDPLDANEKALFGEANYDFSDSLRLTLGSRLYSTEVEGTLESSGATAGNNGATPGTEEKGWSPKIALTYKPSNDVMFYATVSRGFQFGGFNLPTLPSPGVPLTFKSSTLWNYEIGTRTDWFDNTLRFDLTAFFIDWKNPQIRQTDNAASGYVDNVGGTHNIGAETTIRWITPIDGLSIEQAASYIEARTTEEFDDASGVTVPKGTLMPSSPLMQSVTTLAYVQPIGNWMTQTSLINSLVDNNFADITHRTKVGDFSLLNFNFNITRTDLSFAPSLTLSVNNITNVQKVVAGFGPDPESAQGAIDDILGNSSYVYTQPRSIVVRLSAEF
jgi:iron complex outermembrane receptor protein